MKILLVFVLLFLNVSFVVWQYQLPPRAPAPFSAADPGVEKLLLLSEATTSRDDRDRVSLSAPTPEPEASTPEPSAALAEVHLPVAQTPMPPPVVVPDRCYTLGPFTERADGEGALEKLVRSGQIAELVSRDRIESRFWVFLPPYPSAQAAFRTAASLKQRGIADLQVIATEGKENAISLGLFKDRAAADRRQRQIAKLGYAPDTEELPRAVTEYWVEYTEPGETPDTEPPEWVQPPLQREPRECR